MIDESYNWLADQWDQYKNVHLSVGIRMLYNGQESLSGKGWMLSVCSSDMANRSSEMIGGKIELCTIEDEKDYFRLIRGMVTRYIEAAW